MTLLFISTFPVCMTTKWALTFAPSPHTKALIPSSSQVTTAFSFCILPFLFELCWKCPVHQYWLSATSSWPIAHCNGPFLCFKESVLEDHSATFDTHIKPSSPVYHRILTSRYLNKPKMCSSEVKHHNSGICLVLPLLD